MFLFETILKYIEVTFLETKYAAWYVQGTIKILFNELYTFLIEKDWFSEVSHASCKFQVANRRLGCLLGVSDLPVSILIVSVKSTK